MSDAEFDALFTTDRPVVFAYHGYPWLIHRLTYRRTNHHNLHVRGYKEEGTTTTPFDMVMLNDLDRFHLVIDVIDRVPGLGSRAGTSARRWPTDGSPRGLHARARRGSARDPRLGLAALSDAACALVVNAGSSSLKLRVLDDDDELSVASRPCASDGDRRRRRPGATPSGRSAPSTPSVTGSSTAGRSSPAPVLIDDGVGRQLRALCDLAPLHQPKSLAALEVTRAALPGVPTQWPASTRRSMHHASRGERPTPCRASGVSDSDLRRYGFHGLSHAYASRRAAELLGRTIERARIVTCHLGAGASLAAVTAAARSTRRWASHPWMAS